MVRVSVPEPSVSPTFPDTDYVNVSVKPPSHQLRRKSLSVATLLLHAVSENARTDAIITVKITRITFFISDSIAYFRKKAKHI